MHSLTLLWHGCERCKWELDGCTGKEPKLTLFHVMTVPMSYIPEPCITADPLHSGVSHPLTAVWPHLPLPTASLL